MRLVSATTLALVTALSSSLQAAQQAGAAAPRMRSRKVAGGGITAAGWKGKVDAGEAAKGGKIERLEVRAGGSEFRINNGPAAIYWNPAHTASGSYTVSATFTEPKYMSSNDHPHPYGLFIGGNKLDTDQASAALLHAVRQRHVHRPRLRAGAVRAWRRPQTGRERGGQEGGDRRQRDAGSRVGRDA